MTRILLIICAVLLATACAVAASQSVSVYDGDTLTVDGVKWRLWGVDAFERHQDCEVGPCGLFARDHLAALVRGKVVTCEQRGRSYDRIVGRCWADVDLAGAQVEAGWALDYTRYSKGEYADEEAEAQYELRGAWAGEFVRPEEWRKR